MATSAGRPWHPGRALRVPASVAFSTLALCVALLSACTGADDERATGERATGTIIDDSVDTSLMVVGGPSSPSEPSSDTASSADPAEAADGADGVDATGTTAPPAVTTTTVDPATSTTSTTGGDAGTTASTATATTIAPVASTTTVATTGPTPTTAPPPDPQEEPGDGVLLAVLIIATGGDLEAAVAQGLVTEEDVEAALQAIADGSLDDLIP